ncbi:MAG: hypothetical protein JW834_03030 [Candidatus Diapherotrites archaeon]|nr:hypothetical protein [Candidatus Diapherotrites archaeon]
MGLIDKFMAGNTMYFQGCLTKYVAKDLSDNYRTLLSEAGIDFIELKDLEVCCGSPILNAGFPDDAKRLAEKNFKQFRDHGVKRIIANCPGCYYFLKHEYPKMLPQWDIRVDFVTDVLKTRSGAKSGKVTFHDPCHLGRYAGVYDSPRQVLKSSGYEVVEMEHCREDARCCGAGGGVKAGNPILADAVAKDRVEEARRTGAESLVTVCPMCYLHLKDKGMPVKELSQVLK